MTIENKKELGHIGKHEKTKQPKKKKKKKHQQ
jgi:hypothetical protein